MQKSIISLIICAFFGLNLQSQTAPNFTITDTEGIDHRLYEDYLDQGKTVVIKIFFTSCPPCISISPATQNLYEDWGSGQFDVEFFELSNKSFDSNADVASYKAAYGNTFPGAGQDGNALGALEPYTSGTFGSFFGTPTFVVIAPDRTVNYGVNGAGNSGKIAALDAAIEATGATGKEEQPDGPIPAVFIFEPPKDAFGESVNQVNYVLSSENGDEDLPILLNAAGEFWIFDLEDEYPQLTNPVIKAKKSDEVFVKVSAIDQLVILRHVLTTVPITDPDLLIAADTNGDGTITSFDLLYIQKIILGIYDQFPNQDTYRFFPESIPLEFNPGQRQNIDFKAIKVGDLNGF